MDVANSRFTAIITLIGSLAGYAAGLITSTLIHQEKMQAVEAQQVHDFSATLTGNTGLRNAGLDQKIAYLGGLYALASSAETPLRAQQKKIVIALVGTQENEVQVRMSVVYAGDDDAVSALNELTAVKLKLINAIDSEDMKARPAAPAVDRTISRATLPSVNLSPTVDSGWVYLGKSNMVKGRPTGLFDAYIAGATVPSANQTISFIGSVNLRDSPPSKTKPIVLGRIVGVVHPGTRATITASASAFPINDQVDAIWVPVSLLR